MGHAVHQGWGRGQEAGGRGQEAGGRGLVLGPAWREGAVLSGGGPDHSVLQNGPEVWRVAWLSQRA